MPLGKVHPCQILLVQNWGKKVRLTRIGTVNHPRTTPNEQDFFRCKILGETGASCMDSDLPRTSERTFGLEGPEGAVDDALVGSVERALLDHLGLVLHEQFDALDGSGRRLGDDGGGATEREVLDESELGSLLRCHGDELLLLLVRDGGKSAKKKKKKKLVGFDLTRQCGF